MNTIYDSEDNEPMIDYSIPEYTGIINDRLFRKTGELIVKGARNDEEVQPA